jgi:hypothetical protein
MKTFFENQPFSFKLFQHYLFHSSFSDTFALIVSINDNFIYAPFQDMFQFYFSPNISTFTHMFYQKRWGNDFINRIRTGNQQPLSNNHTKLPQILVIICEDDPTTSDVLYQMI